MRQAAAKRWEVNLASVVVAPPVVEGGVVMVRTGNGHIHGLNATDGGRKWLYTRQLPALSLHGVSALAAKEGLAYAGYAGGKIATGKKDPAVCGTFAGESCSMPHLKK